MALTRAPFGTYVQPTAVLLQVGQTEVMAMLDVFLAMLPTVTGGVDSNEVSSPSPEFMDISRHYVEKITAEITDIKTKIDAMPIV